VDLLHQAPLDRDVTKRRTFDEEDDPGRLASGTPVVNRILSRVLAQIDSDVTEAIRVIQRSKNILNSCALAEGVIPRGASSKEIGMKGSFRRALRSGPRFC
jgi:hypothetical protein